MEIISDIFSFILHIDEHLNNIISAYGALTYAILFFIIFMETGFVVTPFLPGDSLLFAAGSFAALGSLNVWFMLLILFIAAVLGDTVNYFIGQRMGPKVFERNSRFFKKEHLSKTQKFYDKYGGKTIILARFIPIIRTFAPFVAGVGTMQYSKFILYNIVGGFLWVSIFLLGGYFFGNIPFFQNNFEIVIFVIILVSVVPMIIEAIKHKKNNKNKIEKEEIED